MFMTARYGGWVGRVLRVDLSTGRITTEDTVEKYKDYIGGTGIGYKVLWDEVPADTKVFDPENKIIFATGPLAGTSAMQRKDRRNDSLAHLLAQASSRERAHGRPFCRGNEIRRVRRDNH